MDRDWQEKFNCRMGGLEVICLIPINENGVQTEL